MLFLPAKVGRPVSSDKALRQVHRHSVAFTEFSCVTSSLFRGHVAGCAEHVDRASDAALRIQQTGEAKVSQMWFTVLSSRMFPGLMSRCRMLCSCA
jgi:hypothetical protein